MLRETGINGELNGLGGAFGANERLLKPAKQLVDVRADVNVQRLNVDSRADATADDFVSVRHIDATLIVNMSATYRNLRNAHTWQISQDLLHSSRVSLIGLRVLV